MDGWMDEWMGGWVDGWMDGQTISKKLHFKKGGKYMT